MSQKIFVIENRSDSQKNERKYLNNKNTSDESKSADYLSEMSYVVKFLFLFYICKHQVSLTD